MTAFGTDYGTPDVVIVGGGPAGSVAASALARAGHRTLVLERDRFPRYHVGESLLSATLPIFDAIEVTDAIERHGFVRKPGGTFQWGSSPRPWSFWFREDPGGRPHAFHVIRSEFDELLLNHAREQGADVREEHAVTRVETDRPEPVVHVRSRQGREARLTPRFVIDASGQSALLGRARDLRRFDEFFKNLAIFGYFRGAEPLGGAEAGNILSVAFGDGWFWFIPLHDGTTSVGAVVDAKRCTKLAAGGLGTVFCDLIPGCPEVPQRLRDATLVSEVRSIRDYSYTSTRFAGPGHLLAGDAACFIDPVFSTGVHLASLAGFLSARAVSSVLSGGVDEAAALADYEEAYRGAYERFLRFLYFFYDHNQDPDSYFWTARRVLAHAPGDLTLRQAFVRLISGGNDWNAIAPVLEREHARWEAGIQSGQTRAVPGSDLFRVRNTLNLTRLPHGGPAA